MRKLILALLVLPLLSGAALAKGPGGHGGPGGASHSASGPSYGGPDPSQLGPLADSDWRVQWVLKHQQTAPLAGHVAPQGPTT
jgi:hypothetical protein